MPFGVGYGQGNKNPLGMLFGGGGQQPPQGPGLAPGASTLPPPGGQINKALPQLGPEDFFGLEGQSSKGYAGNIGAAGLSGIYGFGPQAQQAGFTNLLQILQGQGATDPALMNRTLAGISQGTQGQQADLRGRLAALGLSGSGIGQALGAAVGQAGANKRADILAQEAQIQEARKREDLNLLLNLILNPGLGAMGLNLGVPTSSIASNKGSAILGGLGTGLGAAFGSMGGPLGAAGGAALGGGVGSAVGSLYGDDK